MKIKRKLVGRNLIKSFIIISIGLVVFFKINL